MLQSVIKSLGDFPTLVREIGPKRTAILAPEDEDFMGAVQCSAGLGYIEPVLIGNVSKMEHVAEALQFDISSFEKVPEHGRQGIADLGLRMLFSGEVQIACKGQIPTSYVCRSAIREERRTGSGRTVCGMAFWDLPDVDHLVMFTDAAVNIRPDLETKKQIIKGAVFACHLMGISKPRIGVLSGQTKAVHALTSHEDYLVLKAASAAGEFGECEIVEGASFAELMLGGGDRMLDYGTIDQAAVPDILLVPSVDSGNIVGKIAVPGLTHGSLALTSRGPICLPPRSDPAADVVLSLAMCAVFADRIADGGGIQ